MTVLLKQPPPRRTLLRGLLGGGAVSVALPFLDIFLDDNGRALASGAALPVRFGTWYWGLGHTPGHAIGDRAQSGAGIAFLDECAPLKRHHDVINYYGGFTTPLDGSANFVHMSGWIGLRTGTAPTKNMEISAPTLDLMVADAIGPRTRFKTLDISCLGDPTVNFSARSSASRSLSETSPVEFYRRLFGADFTDPNRADFTPDPATMVRRSVLSAVADHAKDFSAQLGAADRARMDQYFTSIRQVEQQFALQLEKPAANAACRVPASPDGSALISVEIDTVRETHRAMLGLLAMAVACDQTRVFNIAFCDALSRIRRAGEAYTHHNLTHEESTDKVRGYQPTVFLLNCQSMDACADMIDAFAAINEGDGTLLDNMLVFAHSETSFARVHSVDNIPIMTMGRAGGRMKTGYHIVGNGDPITRVGYTAMHAVGAPLESWGTKSLRTSKVIGEVLA